MNYNDKIMLMWRGKDNRYIVILKDGYKHDGSAIIEGDTMESVIADVVRADDRWVTINGSHVLIGGSGRIKYGAGGAFNGKLFGTVFQDYNRPKAKNGKRLVRPYNLTGRQKSVAKPDKPKKEFAHKLGRLQGKNKLKETIKSYKYLKEINTDIQHGNATAEIDSLPTGSRLKLKIGNYVYRFKKNKKGEFDTTLNGKPYGIMTADGITAGNDKSICKNLRVIGMPEQIAEKKAKAGDFTVKEIGNRKTYHPDYDADPYEIIENHLGKKLTDLQRDKVKKGISAITEYTGVSYARIRRNKTQEAHEQNKVIDYVIEHSPSYKGTIYRGIHLKQKEFEELIKKVENGIPFDQKGVSSWSSDARTAKSFVDDYPGFCNVVFVSRNGFKRSTSIRHLSYNQREDEVLVSRKTNMKAKRIIRASDNFLEIEVEEA